MPGSALSKLPSASAYRREAGAVVFEARRDRAVPLQIAVRYRIRPQCDLLTQMSYHRGDTLVAQRSYAYDALGRPTQRDTARSGGVMHDTFAHNTRSELVNAQINGEAYSYAYDNISNRESAQEAVEKITQYKTNELNQYTSVGNFTPQFEAAGNQTRVQTNTGTWQVTYNAENRPVRFESEGSNLVVECAYDFMGRRCYKKKTTNGAVTLHQRYIYRGYLQISACDLTRAASPCLWLILWDPTQATATRPLAIQKDGVWYAYGWDLTKNICENLVHLSLLRIMRLKFNGRKTTILISDKEVKVEGYTSDVSISDIADQGEPRRMSFR